MHTYTVSKSPTLLVCMSVLKTDNALHFASGFSLDGEDAFLTLNYFFFHRQSFYWQDPRDEDSGIQKRYWLPLYFHWDCVPNATLALNQPFNVRNMECAQK